MWDLTRPGLEPVSPALAGGFLTTVPPGKSAKGLLDAAHLPRLNRTGPALLLSVFCFPGVLSTNRYEKLLVDLGCHLFASLPVGPCVHLSDWTGNTEFSVHS